MERSVVRFVVHPLKEVENQKYLLDPDYKQSEMEKLLEAAEMEDSMIEKPCETGCGPGVAVKWLYGKCKPEQFQDEVARYWRRAGVDISFD